MRNQNEKCIIKIKFINYCDYKLLQKILKATKDPKVSKSHTSGEACLLTFAGTFHSDNLSIVYGLGCAFFVDILSGFSSSLFPPSLKATAESGS